jgi:acyl-coenzyme A synthetase/AMP-(fatty) acid ligase
MASRNGHAITRDRFLADVSSLAARLPAADKVINLCDDRYWFAVAFAACISRGIVSLLPHSTAIGTLAWLAGRTPGAWLLVDTEEVPPLGLPSVQVAQALPSSAVSPGQPCPQVAADQHVATVFTSGSTGEPQAHDKLWGPLHASVTHAARRLWAAAGGPCSVIGTPSFRHMYGLESSVLLPLLAGGCLTARQPFFPADVAAALEEAPAPRLLVTTPFHLRKLMESGVALPRVAAVLSATAPLAPEVAQACEAAFQAPLLEIYGATEFGQIATRRPRADAAWELLEGYRLTQVDGATILEGTGRPEVLNDVVELLGPGRFNLVDRTANLVNIVGKRSSLGHLNHLLTQIPGVRDGVFCLPEHLQTKDDARLAAFVVAPGLSAADILAGLRPLVDAVFLPRPLVLIDHLPRDVNGKVASATLRQLVQAHLPPRT